MSLSPCNSGVGQENWAALDEQGNLICLEGSDNPMCPAELCDQCSGRSSF